MKQHNLCVHCNKPIEPGTGGFFETRTIDSLNYYNVEYHQTCYHKMFFRVNSTRNNCKHYDLNKNKKV